MAEQAQESQVTYETYLATRNVSDTKNLPAWVVRDSLRDITEFAYNELNFTTDSEVGILRSLIGIAKQNSSIVLSYRSLLKNVQAKSPGITEGALHEKLHGFLATMEQKGHCLCEREEDMIKNLVLVKGGYKGKNEYLNREVALVAKITKYYEDLLQSKNFLQPFANRKRFNISEELLAHTVSLDVNSFNKEKINEIKLPESTIVSLDFASSGEILIPARYLNKLFSIALQKIKHYLRIGSKKNIRDKIFGFINQSLETRGQNSIERDRFDIAIDNYAFDEYANFDSSIWITTLQLLLSGSKGKVELLDINQSADLLIHYINHESEKAKGQQNQEKKKKQKEKAFAQDIPHIIKQASSEFRPFSEKRLAEMEDANKEKTIKDKYKEDVFKELLQKLIQENILDADSPQLIYFEHNSRLYFLHKDRIVTFVKAQIEMVPGNFLNQYRLPWSQDIKNINLKNKPLFYDNDFHEFLTEFVEQNYPLLKRILEQAQILYRISQNFEGKQKNVAKDWFLDNRPGQIKSIVHIIGMSRKYVYNEALHQLSLLYWWPPYRKLMAWLRGKKTEPSTGGLGGKKNANISRDKKSDAGSRQLEELPGSEFDDHDTSEGLEGYNAHDNMDRRQDASAKKEKSKVGLSSIKEETAKEQKKKDERKKDREKQKKEKAMAEKLRDKLLGGEDIEKQLLQQLKIWNPNLDGQTGMVTKKNVDDAINAYVQRSIINKIPLDKETLSNMIKKLIDKDNFEPIHQGKSQKKEALNKYAQLYIYQNYIQPKYKL